MFRGESPFGNRQGASGIRKTKFGDLLTTKEDGSRTIKDIKVLTAEFGSVASARWAKKAYEAALAERKEMLMAPKSAEAVVAAAKVIRTVLVRMQEFLYWTVRGVKNGEVASDHLDCSYGVTVVAPQRPYAVDFPVRSVAPEKFQRKKVARAAIYDFMRHARIYRAEKLRKAAGGLAGGQPRDPWGGLAGDERAAIGRICEAGEKATWKVDFLFIWQNPKTFRRPP
ncbi:unnamed protein product [Closterium sp. NIES-64]|nr:unnamed protein product [Closterium sp. NIES-64]